MPSAFVEESVMKPSKKNEIAEIGGTTVGSNPRSDRNPGRSHPVWHENNPYSILNNLGVTETTQNQVDQKEIWGSGESYADSMAEENQSNGNDHDESDHDLPKRLNVGAAIAIGVGVGAAISIATGSAVWIPVGIAIGAGIGTANQSKSK